MSVHELEWRMLGACRGLDAGVFYPDSDETTARNNLRRLLARARELPFSEQLEIERQRVRWPVGTDIVAFRQALEAQDWAGAVELYRGELLEGLSVPEPEWEDWIKIERSRLRGLAIAARAARPSSLSCVISAMVSYQMPASACPSFGLALTSSVSTTSKSTISPGISAELKTRLAPGACFIVASCGFQATAAVTSSEVKAPAISASDVLTVLTSVILRLAPSSARANK